MPHRLSTPESAGPEERPGFRPWEDESTGFGITQEIVAFSNPAAAARRAVPPRPVAAADALSADDPAGSIGQDQETRPREMDHDVADPFVETADRDVLRRERDDLSANFDPPVVVGRDAHRVAGLAPVGIARIVLDKCFGAGFRRDGEGFLSGHFLAAPVSDRSHAALPCCDLFEPGENPVEPRDSPILFRYEA